MLRDLAYTDLSLGQLACCLSGTLGGFGAMAVPEGGMGDARELRRLCGNVGERAR